MSGVLVTGARGFAGSHLIELLSHRGVAVTGWGRENVDLLDRSAVTQAIAGLKPEIVYTSPALRTSAIPSIA